MGQEFTNVSYAKPLWKYAIDVYSENKTQFLNYQDNDQLCVNDLIALGFCKQHLVLPTQPWWRSAQMQSLRYVISALRELRNRPSNSSIRDIVLKVELHCEQQDLNFIASDLAPNNDWPVFFSHFCSDHRIKDKRQLALFIDRLNQKKGA